MSQPRLPQRNLLVATWWRRSALFCLTVAVLVAFALASTSGSRGDGVAQAAVKRSSPPCLEAFPDARRKSVGKTTWYNRQESARMVVCYRFGLEPSADFPVSWSMACGLVGKVIGKRAPKLALFEEGACSGIELAGQPKEPTKYIGIACSWAATLLGSGLGSAGCTLAPPTGTALGNIFESKHQLDVAIDVIRRGKCIKYSPTHFGSAWLADDCAAGDKGFATLPVYSSGPGGGSQPGGGGGGSAGGGGTPGSGGGTILGTPGLTNVHELDAGGYGTCASQINGPIVCWGEAAPAGGLIWTPQVLAGTSGSTGLSVGFAHACAAFADGSARCWGSNSKGDLGNGAVNSGYEMPSSVQGLSGVKSVTAGNGFFSCALLVNGHVVCWGENAFGELGDGSTEDSATPVEVHGIQDATAIALGAYHACSLLSGGTVKCWGQNINGELGDGTTENRSEPVEARGVQHAVGIGSGDFHSCAILAGGEAECWGDNFYGQLGNGQRSFAQASPVVVDSLDEVVAIDGGFEDTCALLNSGTVYCWGENRAGELGNGSIEATDTPTPALGISTATDIGVGELHTCANTSLGVYCWGDNRLGQLGVESWENSPLPVPVAGP